MERTIIKPTTPVIGVIKAGATWWLGSDNILRYLATMEDDTPPTILWTEEEEANLLVTCNDCRPR